METKNEGNPDPYPTATAFVKELLHMQGAAAAQGALQEIVKDLKLKVAIYEAKIDPADIALLWGEVPLSGQTASPPPAFEEGVASVAPPSAAADASREAISQRLSAVGAAAAAELVKAPAAVESVAPSSIGAGGSLLSLSALLRVARGRLDLLERENAELRTGAPGYAISCLQDELRAAREEIKAEEVIREALTSRLEEQNALLDEAVCFRRDISVTLGLGKEAPDSREATEAIWAGRDDSARRLRRLDALLASKEPPEGLRAAMGAHRGGWYGDEVLLAAWRWLCGQLGKPPSPPLDSVEREIAAAEEAGGAP